MDTMHPAPDGQPSGELAAPLAGEVVTTSAVMPSAAEVRADAKGRVGNTFTQVGVPAAILTLLVYASGFWHLDLDPTGPGRDMPTLASNALLVLFTWLLCRRMNRDGLNATDDTDGA